MQTALPSALSKLVSTTGVHRRGFKVLAFGPTGSGKSFLLAHMPRPLVVIELGEGGIQSYLLPPVDGKPDLERVFAGEEDLCFTVTHPNELEAAVEWVFKHETKLKSVVIEPMNAAWEDHMDYWNEKLGGDIQGGQWRKVKGPWKRRLKRLMRSPLNVGFGCWMKDIAYERAEPKNQMPGVESQGKLIIKAQEVPQAEKSVPYTVDLILQTEVVLDKKNRPTSKHRVTLTKGRRPRSIDPKDFHVGKTWEFDAVKPVDPWATIIGPLEANWQSDENGAVDYLGADAQEARSELREISEAADDNEVGRMIILIGQPYKNLIEYRRMFETEIAPPLNTLSKPHRETVMSTHEMRKKGLS